MSRSSGPYLHELKCWPEPFQAIKQGRKRFELRRNDRDFRVDDDLKLLEFDPQTGSYTGAVLFVHVDYITDGQEYGLPAGWVIMSTGTPLYLTSERIRALHQTRSLPSVEALRAEAEAEAEPYGRHRIQSEDAE